jgi:hypothetical protein
MAELIGEGAKREADLFKRVFNTPDGKEVLQIMMEEMHVFDTIMPADVSDLVLRNYCISLLARMGILLDKNMDSIVDRLMEMDYN